MYNYNKCEEGFTGLEAAIVLIAFVVVAAVFSYVVLGAGFFTSQTAQSTVHTSVAQASSSMELVGNTYGIADSSRAYLDYANVTVALTAGGTPIDLSSMVVSYTDNNGGHEANLTYEGIESDGGSCPNTGNTAKWCIAQKINNVTAGAMLDKNAQMVIMVGLPTTATPNTQFSINFQPSVGAVLPITRTIPGGLTAVQALY
ncbi:MAG: archaellin/type IV pilin N-terminal domain-containing protein [Methanoregula sp.]|jgi:flagellin FlaB|uniref:archaellin/type IV pilin N-terminal domain-containing protein n=1 Tax=Methanoregula sp. TaxID=2052170 RepID=UPI003C1694FB